MEEPIKGEFRLVANQLSGIFLERSQGPDEDTSWYKGLTERLLYQHNATLNLAQRSMAGFLAGSESPPDDCEIVQMHLVYNPVGKVLACIATPSYEEYFERLRTTQAATGELAASLH